MVVMVHIVLMMFRGFVFVNLFLVMHNGRIKKHANSCKFVKFKIKKLYVHYHNLKVCQHLPLYTIKVRVTVV